MSIFFAVFFTIYTCIHVFVLARARTLLPDGWPLRLSLVLFCLIMILAPAAVRLLERSGHEAAARMTAYGGYTWMGFIFLAFTGVLVLSLFELGAKPFCLVTETCSLPYSNRSLVGGVLALAAILSVYGLFEAQSIRVERVQILTDKLPAGIDRLKVVQVSDVHLGLLMRGERLKPIVERVIEENPDVFVSTGDLVDGNMGNAVGEITDCFAQIEPRFGKFAILGNHEYYAGLSESVDHTERFGFRLLRDEASGVPGIINIVGMDDMTALRGEREAALLKSVGNGLFTLFLKHRPSVSDESRGLFDLQLSGHSHRGQIFPFRLLTHFAYPLQNGLYHLGNGAKLYTSRGTGTWGPPMRVFSPPEVTVIELVRTNR